MRSSNTNPVCATCGDRIGVYEPIWIEQTDGTLTTTGLLEMSQHSDGEPHAVRLYHFGCLAPNRIPDQSAA